MINKVCLIPDATCFNSKESTHLSILKYKMIIIKRFTSYRLTHLYCPPFKPQCTALYPQFSTQKSAQPLKRLYEKLIRENSKLNSAAIAKSLYILTFKNYNDENIRVSDEEI